MSFLADNVASTNPVTKRKEFSKPVSLPPTNSRRTVRKAKVKEIAIKSKAVVATNKSRKEKLQSVQCSDLLSIAESIVFLCLNIDKLLAVLPSEVLIDTLLQRYNLMRFSTLLLICITSFCFFHYSDGTGFLSSGHSLVSALRHVYEEVRFIYDYTYLFLYILSFCR